MLDISSLPITVGSCSNPVDTLVRKVKRRTPGPLRVEHGRYADVANLAWVTTNPDRDDLDLILDEREHQ